jgi:hypothetical protein
VGHWGIFDSGVLGTDGVFACGVSGFGGGLYAGGFGASCSNLILFLS